ncbi:hypothetical protein [Pseudomonas lurida]|uniref:hypothetical protein n=1 Tax=Pseudomonas lurida TaxID=244566 RepID=UPI0034D953FE
MTTELIDKTGVVLSDGTGVTITVRITWTKTPTITINIPAAIFSFFHTDGYGLQTTLLSLVSDLNVKKALSDTLKLNFSANTAEIISIVVTSPPIELRAKQVIAILASGETVRVTFTTPSGIPRAPTTSEIKKVFELMSTINYSQIGSIKSLINAALATPNRGWDFDILGLEQISCACPV